MKINEILQENAVGTLQPDVADALPNTTVLTDFKNTDPYEQYRMGLAIAGPQGGGTLNGTAMKAEAQPLWKKVLKNSRCMWMVLSRLHLLLDK